MTTETLNTFKNGGCRIEPALTAILTNEGRELYRVLTHTQNKRWREIISKSLVSDSQHQRPNGGPLVTITLGHYERRKVIDALVDWGALNGRWVTDNVWEGSVPNHLVTPEARGLEPEPEPKLSRNLHRSTTPLLFPDGDTVSDTPPQSYGIPYGMLVGAVGLALLIGTAFGVMLRSLNF